MSVSIIPVNVKVPKCKANNNLRLIKLPNGLESILITDPDANSTGISLSVNAGSLNDNGIMGLAHLMEHMIFTNSKEFQQPYHLVQNVNKAGGIINAFTTYHQTIFYFEIPNSSKLICEINSNIQQEVPVLNYLLNVFSSNFKTPTFNSQLIKSEIFDIDEEHSNNLNSIDKKFYYCLKKLSSSKFQNFTTGNLETLSVKNKKNLISYFEKYYISSNIKVVIKGSQSLNSLQKLIISNFYNIPIGKPTVTEYPPLFDVASKNKLLYVHDEVNTMRVVFPIYKLNDNLLQICKIWIEILGNEQLNSLCDYLRQKNWINELLSFDQMIDVNNLLIIIQLKLTKSGRKEITKVVSSIFKYIQVILEAGTSKIQRFINEFLITEKLKFIYQEPDNTLSDEVTKLAELMSYVNYKDLLLGYKIAKVSPKLFLVESKRWFNFDNINIILFSESFSNDLIVPASDLIHDKFYNFDCQYFMVDKTQIYVETMNTVDYLKFPASNKFLDYSEEELDYLTTEIADSSLNYHVKNNLELVPQLIEKSLNFELWFNEGFKYHEKIFTSFELLIRDLPLNCMNCIAIDLITEILGNKLRIKFYQSENLGYSWSSFANLDSSNSISFNLNGLKKTYQSVLKEFIKEILEGLISIDKMPYSQFMKARIKVRTEYENLMTSDSLTQSIGLLNCIMELDIYSLEERLNTLEEIDFSEVAKVAKKLLENCYTTILINGECNLEFVYEISTIINEISGHLGTENKINFEIPGSYDPLIGKIRYEYPSNKKHCFFYIHLGKRDNPYIRAVSKLLEYLLSLHVPKLRFPRKLGYKVASGLRIFRKTIGIFIYIESNAFNFQSLNQNIEDLLYEIKQILEGLTELEFQETLLKPCLNSLKFANDSILSPNLVFDIPPRKSSTNFDQVSKNYLDHKSTWEKIINRNYRFDGKYGNEKVDQNLLRSFSRIEILNFFTSKVSPESNLRSILLLTNKVDEKDLLYKMNAYIENKRLRIPENKKKNLIQLKDFNIIQKEIDNYYTSKGNIKAFLKNIQKLPKLFEPVQIEKVLLDIRHYQISCNILKNDQHFKNLEPFK